MANDPNQFDMEDVGKYLLEELVKSNLIESSEAFVMSSQVMLSEAKTENNTEFRGKDISFDSFKRVYSNYDSYPTSVAVLQGLGVDISQITSGDSATKAVRRIAKHFRVNGKTINGLPIVPPGMRIKYYSRQARIAMKNGGHPYDPSIDDIDPGERNKRNRATVIVDKINAQEIIPGEFYANHTRIPKSRWASWWKFWDQSKQHVRPNKFSLTGQHWGKTFILGYQIDQKMFVEIWYNSLDSSFSLYDRNGVELGTPVETVQEAIRHLTLNVARMDKTDGDIFAHGINNGVAQSMMRSLSKDLTGEVGELRRQDMLKSRQDAEDSAHVQAKADAKRQARVDRVTQYKRKKKIEAATYRVTRKLINKGKSFDYETFKQEMKREYTDMRGDAANWTTFVKYDLPTYWEDAKSEYQQAKSEYYRNNTAPDPEEAARVVDIQSQIRQGNEQRAKRQAEQRAKADKEFQDKHGTNMKNALNKARNSMDRIKNTDQESASSAEREAALIAQRKQLAKDIADEGQPDETTSNGKSGLGKRFNLNPRRNKMEESYVPMDEDGIDQRAMDSRVENIRTHAENSAYTQAALKGKVMQDLFTIYHQTKADDSMATSRFSRWMRNLFFKNRKDKIISPTDPAPIWDSIKMGLKGQKYRADFIVGFSLADKVNIEIWYVTEPGPETDRFNMNTTMQSSFYVYDVTSKTVVRKYLPYYRNAVQVAYSKLGTTL